MGSTARWVWPATIAIVAVIGCGGNNPPYVPPPAGPFLGSWSGQMKSSDGTYSTLNITVDMSGAASGTVQIPSDSGVVYAVSGTVLGSGDFEVSGPVRTSPSVAISATVIGTGTTTGTGTDGIETLTGSGMMVTVSGVMTVGATRVSVTFNLSTAFPSN